MTHPLSPARVRAALDGDAQAMRELIDELLPVVQARAARAILRHRPPTRDSRQELSDLVQEVFAALFEERGRVLRHWDPARGLSLRNFVGLVAERTLGALMRSGRRTPWPDEPTDPVDMEHLEPEDPASRIESRAELEQLLDRLTEELSPRSLELFYKLCVRQEDVRSVALSTGMTEQAVYAARARFERLAKKIVGELRGQAKEVCG